MNSQNLDLLGMNNIYMVKKSSKSISTHRVTKIEPDTTDSDTAMVNDVHLVGRVSSLPISRIFPSGDEVVEFRITIERKSGYRSITGRKEVDSLELGAWKARERRKALKLVPGDFVNVQGSVHRRFWSSPKGLSSRWQIEIHLLQKL